MGSPPIASAQTHVTIVVSPVFKFVDLTVGCPGRTSEEFTGTKSVIEDGIGRLRAALDELATTFRSKAKEADGPQGAGAPQYEARDANVTKALRSVAKRGRSIQEAIFGGEPERVAHFESLIPEGPVRLHILIRPGETLLVPWGALFTLPSGTGLRPPVLSKRDTGKLIDQLTEEELRAGFWCNKYGVIVETIDQSETDKDTEVGAVTLKEIEFVNALHQQCLEFARKRNFLDRDFKDPWNKGQYIKTIDALDELLSDIKAKRPPNEAPAALLHFFGHARHGEVFLDADLQDGLSPARLRRSIGSNTRLWRGVLFMNGCNTWERAASDHKMPQLRSAVAPERRRGADPDTWPDLAFELGFAGSIVTEAIVPTLVAWLVGIDILRGILDEKMTIAASLQRVYEDHWPLSILYTAYCHSGLTIKGVNLPHSGPRSTSMDWNNVAVLHER